MSSGETEEKVPAEEAAVAVSDFLKWIEQPEDAAACSVVLRNNNNSNNGNVDLLRTTCAALFQRIETLGQQLDSTSTSTTTTTRTTLSGLDQLFTGGDDDDDQQAVVDAETIWGQVDLQNQALHKRLKRSVKQLSRADRSSIRLLEEDMETSSSDSGEDDDKSGDNKQREEKEINNRDMDDGESGSENEEELDEETKRIRARMSRAMDDMQDDDDDEEAQEEEEDSEKEDEFNNYSDLENDRDAANLADGFFNLQEMEAFADEEEAYLPDAAYGEEHNGDDDDEDKEKQQVDTRSFHQKQREGVDAGAEIDDDDSDEEEEDELLFRKESSVRRRKYRKDDEVDALFGLYKSTASNDDDDDDDDEDDEIINMTAADLFGKPDKKYYERYYKNKKGDKDDVNDKRDDGDDDSWNEYDFNQDEGKSGWNDDDEDEEENEEELQEQAENEDELDDDDNDDEDVPMNGKKKAAPKPPTKQAAKILAQTEQLEKEMLAEKPWQMLGETGSTARPVNSLLDTTPEFEVASKMAPVITVEHTENLEEIVKRRILAEDWDDVIPRELPDVGWHKQRGELPEVSQEKSKLSLGELYEREYLKKAIGYDVDAAEKETEEQKAKNEMKSLFANLCSKLDALSNYHFAPRPIADEAEVRPITQPAIAMEEVLPLHVSDARGVAPEEVYGAKRGRDAVLRADSELDQQERKRLRGAKKAARRKARQAKLADEKLISRLQPGLGLNNPYEKRKMREELSAARAGGKITAGDADMNDYGASTTFFKRMQQEANQTIQGHQSDEGGKKKAARTNTKSSALKL